MLTPIKTTKTEKEHTYLYRSCGYEAELVVYKSPIDGSNLLSVTVNCLYEEYHPYPVIRYNPVNKHVEGTFNSFFSLSGDNETEWVRGVQNASLFIREMNEVLASIREQYQVNKLY